MVKLSDIELPIILKRKLLFSKGYWNNWDISENEVKKAFDNSKWERKKVRALYYQHRDQDAEKWTGNILNPEYENGNVYGDLEIWDAEAALKTVYGKAPYAISAKIVWESKYKDPTNFRFENFSFVSEPGVDKEEIYINFSKEGETENEANLIINQDSESYSPSIERRLSSSQEKMESDDVKKEVLEDQKEAVEEQKAEFSQEDFKKLSERVYLLEQKFSKLDEPNEEKEESSEESEDESETVSEEKSEEIVEEVSEVKEVEESKEESIEEVVEENSTDESKEESSEESAEDETEAKFSNEILEELKGIREVIGKSIVPASAANFSEKTKTGFEAAFDRIEKEFA